MYDAEKMIKQLGAGNSGPTVAGPIATRSPNNKKQHRTIDAATLGGGTKNGNVTNNERMPDQTMHSMFLKEMIELKAIQNSLKNKLRKVLFSADKGKCIPHPPSQS